MKVRKRTRKLPSGFVQVKWVCDLGMVNGRRVEKYFATEGEAKAHLVAVRVKRKAEGDRVFAMTEGDRASFDAAVRDLARVGATIEEAVRYYLATHSGLREEVSLAALLQRFVLAKELEGKRARYVTQLGVSCRSFVLGRHDQLAHTVTREQVAAWLADNEWAGKTQKGYLGDVAAMFSWAMHEGLVKVNPAAGKFRFRAAKEVEIEALSNDQVRTLLAMAAALPLGGKVRHERPVLLWFIVLGLFAGIRPDELRRMGRELVNLDELTVIVPARSSKTRQRRVVDLSENAAEWLALDPLRAGPIVPANWRLLWGRLRAQAGFVAPVWTHRGKAGAAGKAAGESGDSRSRAAWPHDGARHTFASNHYALWQDESLLKAQMGHSQREDTLMQHYRAMRTRWQSVEFWTTTPGDFMPAAAGK